MSRQSHPKPLNDVGHMMPFQHVSAVITRAYRRQRQADPPALSRALSEYDVNLSRWVAMDVEGQPVALVDAKTVTLL